MSDTIAESKAVLVQTVQRIVDESGDGTANDFDAKTWLEEWINQPNPALGGAKPVSYLDTMAGRLLLRNLLLRSQSGAFS